MMETIFNCSDLSLQLFSGSSDETFGIVHRQMNELRIYYDRKATPNVHHSEKIIDVFRFCIRKDKVLSKMLDKDFTGFNDDFMDTAQASTDPPQPVIMEVEPQSKWNGCVAKKYSCPILKEPLMVW